MPQNYPIFLSYFEKLACQCWHPVYTYTYFPHTIHIFLKQESRMNDIPSCGTPPVPKHIYVHPSWFYNPTNVYHVYKDSGRLFIGLSGSRLLAYPLLWIKYCYVWIGLPSFVFGKTKDEDTAWGFHWEVAVERFHVWQRVGTSAD